MTNGNQNVTLYVTHANAIGPFLKIWGQIDNETSRKIESIISRVREHFDRGSGAVTAKSNLIIGSICCAFHEDNYYRARIMEINPDFTVYVHFIDFGNSELVLPASIRLLDFFSEARELLSLPGIAHEFTMTNIMPYTGIWNNNIIEHIKQALAYKESRAIVTFPSRQLVSLFYNGRDFSDYLLTAKMALPATPDERRMIVRMCEQSSLPQYPGVSVMHPPPNIPFDNRINNNHHSMRHNTNVRHFSPPKMIPRENWREPHQQLPQQPPLFQSPNVQLEQSHGFINPVLEKDSNQTVTVSHIVNGPLVFSVQLKDRAQELDTLMNNINNYPLQQLSQRADIATVCLARESKHDTIRRAVVSYVADPQAAKLFYVDFGDSETLSHSRIYDIPPQFIKPLALSVRFSLSGLGNIVVTEEMKQYFGELVKNKVLTVKIQPEEFHSPLMSFGIFYLDGRNILDILCEAFPESTVNWPKRRQLNIGIREDVQVAYIEACSKFFVQLIGEVPILNSLINEITEYIKVAPPLKNIGAGLRCLARSAEDSQWYRAEIISVTSNNVLVHYVDYGNEEQIPRTELRSIRNEKIIKPPPLAFQCILTGFDGVAFDAEVYSKFEEMVFDKSIVMVVQEMKSSAMIVELYDASKKPISNISAMLRSCHTSDTTLNNKPSPHRHDEENTATLNLSTKKSALRTQPLLGHQNKSKTKNIKQIREDYDRRAPKSQSDCHQQSFDNSFENQKTGNWSTTQNDEQRFNKQELRTGKHWMTSPPNEKFNRDNVRNKRFNNRDASSRYDRSDTGERCENDGGSFNFSGRENRGGRGNRSGERGRGYSSNSSWTDKNNSMEKDSWSDKDSTSSRGNNRRGGYSTPRGSSRGGGNRGRRDSGNDGDRLYKPPRSSGFNNRTSPGSRFNDRRSNERNEDVNNQVGNWEPLTSNGGIDKKSTACVPRIPPPNITPGAVKHCEIVYITSPTDFYVQLCPDNEALNVVMTRIEEVYTTGGSELTESSAKIGDDCVAEYSEDSTWYRAVIQSVEFTGAIVKFIDYGNTELVPFNKIKLLNDEFTKLPAQAIHCKLLGAMKAQWDTGELDRFTAVADMKPLEAEFITQENNIYEVLLRQINNGVVASSYINEEFNSGVNLMEAKENSRKRNRSRVSSVNKNYATDYAPLNQQWTEQQICLDEKKEVIVIWLANPNDFYCQLIDTQKEFRSMMEEIQKIYRSRQAIKDTPEIGSSVIAIFEEDKAFYRAEILESVKPHEFKVRYVDFGNCSIVQKNCIFNVEKKFMRLPKQAVHCTLKNILPPDSTNWLPTSAGEIDKLFNIDDLQCIFHEKENSKYIVTLMNNDMNLGKIMIERGVAIDCSTSSPPNLSNTIDIESSCPSIEEHLTRVDISKLIGQSLRVMVSNVEAVNKFHIQLPSALTSEKIITDFMANNDSKVMPKLSQHEVCLGAGCLVETDDGWRRAVVIDCSHAAGIDVHEMRFIDTGAIEVVSLDRMMTLPGELSLMQKQAVECVLKNIPSSTDNDEKLKNMINNKEVIMRVDNLKNDRLIVDLFDEGGKQISMNDNGAIENICPLLPMSIISSVYRVSVSHINHSGSIWLKRLIDEELDEALLKELYDCYSVSGATLDIIPNKLCAAHSADDNWYRARVVYKTANGALVHYIDYGNTEEIESEGLKELEPRFFKQSQLAIETALSVTVDGTEKEQQEILDTYLLNQEFIASISRVGNEWIAEIMISPGINISEKLSTLGVLKSEATPTPVKLDNSIDKFKVSICHTESPTQFWIHKSNDLPALTSFQAKLQNEAANYEIIKGVPEAKLICAAWYSTDKMWYRAEVIDADEEAVTIRFIDYGNTDTIIDPADGMKLLSEEMKSTPPYAIKCRLDLVPSDDDWTREACVRFATLVTSHDSVYAITIAEGNPLRVELFINNESINDILVKENHAMKLQANEELVDEVVELELDPKSAFVSHINSPSEFWVQEEKSVANLELLVDRFLVADMFPKLENIKEGQLCVAKFPEDMSWYRARVISHDDSGTNVIYIDYGNSAVSTEIRVIPEDVASIPPLSRKCCLSLPEGVDMWSYEACQKFIAMADDGATIFLLDILEENETSIVKLTSNGEDVAEHLEKLCQKSIPVEIIQSTPLIVEKSSEIIETSPEIIETTHSDSKYNYKCKDTMSNGEIPEKNEDEVFDDKAEVYISKVNSPSEFWIHNKELTKCLNMISDQLHNVSLDQKVEPASIEIINEDSIANSEEPKLSEELSLTAPKTKKCSLVMPAGISLWSDRACNEFVKLVDNGTTKFIMNTIDDSSEVSLVTLTLNGENVADCLFKFCETHIPLIAEERLPPLGEENSPYVVVSHVVSPGEFWTQAESVMAELEIMADHLSKAASFLPLNTLEEGTICAAQFPEDGHWYRAKILCHSESETEILYIDYGNSAITREIRALPEDIIKIPPLSKFCALELPENIEAWSKEACEKFIELVADGATMFEFQELYKKDPMHVILKINGENVADILLPLCEVVKRDEVKLDSDVVKGSEEENIDIIVNDSQLNEENIDEKIKNISEICAFETCEEIIISQKEEAEEIKIIADSEIINEMNNKSLNLSTTESTVEAEKIDEISENILEKSSNSSTVEANLVQKDNAVNDTEILNASASHGEKTVQNVTQNFEELSVKDIVDGSQTPVVESVIQFGKED